MSNKRWSEWTSDQEAYRRAGGRRRYNKQRIFSIIRGKLSKVICNHLFLLDWEFENFGFTPDY